MFRTILVPLDQSSLSEHALGMAATLVKAGGGQIELLLCHPTTAYDELFEAPLRLSREESVYLNAMVEEVARYTGLSVRGEVRSGRAAEVICARAREVNADLIVMTSHGRTGFRRALLGSVTDSVVRASVVPVLVLRATATASRRASEPTRFRRILIPLDGLTRSDAIVEAAVKIGRACNAVLVLTRIVHPVVLYAAAGGVPFHPTSIVDPEGTEQMAERAREEMIEIARGIERDADLRVEIEVVVSEQSGQMILEVAQRQKVDLIAMATNARGASRLVVASVSDQVMRDCTLPLLMLHPVPGAGMSQGPVLAAEARPEPHAAVAGDLDEIC